MSPDGAICAVTVLGRQVGERALVIIGGCDGNDILGRKERNDDKYDLHNSVGNPT